MSEKAMSRLEAIREVRLLDNTIERLNSSLLEVESKHSLFRAEIFKARKIERGALGTADEANTAQTVRNLQSDFDALCLEEERIRERRQEMLEKKHSLESTYNISPEDLSVKRGLKENFAKNMLIAATIALLTFLTIFLFFEERSVSKARVAEDAKIQKKSFPVVPSSSVAVIQTETLFPHKTTEQALVILPTSTEIEKSFVVPKENSPFLKSATDSLQSATNAKRAAEVIVQNMGKLRKERDVATFFAEGLLKNRDLTEREKAELLSKLTRLVEENRAIERILDDANAEFERDEARYNSLRLRIGEYKVQNPESGIPIPVSVD